MIDANARRPTPTSNRSRVMLIGSFVTAIAVSVGGILVANAEAQPDRAVASADTSRFVAGDIVVQDDFARTAPASWGSAPTGGLYTLSAPEYFSADGQSGVASPPRPGSSLTATLASVASLNVSATTTVAVDALPTAGNGMSVGLQLRTAGMTYYQSTLRLSPDGRLLVGIYRVNGDTSNQSTLVSEIAVAEGVAAQTDITLEFQATGTETVELSTRAWPAGASKPEWQSVASDSSAERIPTAGGLGLWTYLSSGSDAGVARFTSVAATSLELEVAAPAPGEPAPVEPAPDPAPEPEPGEPQVQAPGARAAAGSAEVGTTDYTVPVDAVFVAPNGSDTASGRRDAPVATISEAIRRAKNGGSVVVRGGTYHESVVVPRQKKLTIQSYPDEEVWLDGSRKVTNWASSGAAWVSTGWTATFDSSPTYARGKPENPTPGWQFVNPSHPMAAHPDQVFINGTALDQVGSRAAVKAGNFYVDYAADRLYIGSDPAGKTVKASDLVKAITVASPGSVVRGLGVRNYSPSVPDMGAVSVAAKNVTLENIEIDDSATTGFSVFETGATLRNITVARSGMLGGHASYADGMVADGLLFVDNNVESFNRAPVAGGFKVHRSRDVTISDSVFSKNAGNQLWFDESVYDMTVTGNDVLDGTGYGIVIEISDTATIADNLISRNALDGLFIHNSGNIAIWNNTLTANARNINIVQGSRQASNLSTPGHDPRQKLPDPTMPWVSANISLANNVLADGTFKCVLCVEDYTHARSAAQMKVVSNGNVFKRTTVSSPAWAVVWSRGPGNPATYNTLADFTRATGQDANSLALDGVGAFGSTERFIASLVQSEKSVARPLPATVARLVGKSTGLQHLGAW
jgi:parallel beta-helix repeat protein